MKVDQVVLADEACGLLGRTIIMIVVLGVLLLPSARPRPRARSRTARRGDRRERSEASLPCGTCMRRMTVV